MATKKSEGFAPEAAYTIISKLSGKAIETTGEHDVITGAPSSKENQRFKLVCDETGEYYRIVSAMTGKALDVLLSGMNNGAHIHQWACADVPTQWWRLEKIGRGCYLLTSKASGKCLDIVDISSQSGAKLQIWENVQGENQQWKIKKADAVSAKKAASPAKSAVKRSFAASKAPAKQAKEAAGAKKSAPAKAEGKKPAKSTKPSENK